MSDRLKVSVSSGKYTFSVVPGVSIVIQRYGEPWHEQQDAFNAIISLMYELDAARVVLEAARLLGNDAPREIKLALAKHRALVSDNEKPSEWSR